MTGALAHKSVFPLHQWVISDTKLTSSSAAPAHWAARLRVLATCLTAVPGRQHLAAHWKVETEAASVQHGLFSGAQEYRHVLLYSPELTALLRAAGRAKVI